MYPKLKGKGAEVKDLAVPLQEVFARYKRPGNAEEAVIDKMLVNVAGTIFAKR